MLKVLDTGDRANGAHRVSSITGSVIKALAIALVALAMNVPTLLRGTAPGSACGAMVPFVPGLDRFQNCDSPLFNHLAQSFGLILDPTGETRQGRPGYMALGWLVDRVLTVMTLGRYDASAEGVPSFASAEWGYLLINVAVLTTALLLMLRLLGPDRRRWGLVLLTSLLVIANPVTRAFFWTAHTQMFNLMVPPLAVLLTARAIRGGVSWRWILGTGLGLGLALTVYGSFVVVVGSVAVGLVATRQWWRAAGLAVGAALPMALWWATVQLSTGGFVSVETRDHRQFVWLLDAIRSGAVISELRTKVGWFLTTLTDAQTVFAITILAIVMALLLATALVEPPAPGGEPVSDDRSIPALAILLPVQFAFIAAMGFYQTRLSWGLVMTGITAVALLGGRAPWPSSPRQSAALNWTLGLLSAAWYGYWLLIPGPWH